MYCWYLILLVVILLTGCSSIPTKLDQSVNKLDQPVMLDLPVDRTSESFAQGLDQYIASGDPTLLRFVAEQDVLGEWGMRADAILKLNEKNVSLKKEVVGLNKEVDNLNNEIAGLNQKLENQQDQLKIKEQQLSRTQETKKLLSRDNEILEVTLERLRQGLIDLEKQEQ